MASFELKKASRHSIWMQFAFVGPSGSGKTLGALRFAAGLVPGGKIAVIDTERGRASMHADSKTLLAELPQGFDVLELDAPYHPSRFVEAIEHVARAGYSVCLVDSTSDSWEGVGGCSDIAEAAKGAWNGAKKFNRRMMNTGFTSSMHMIWCFKAQNKVEMIDKRKSDTGKTEYIPLGMQPVCEKNAMYQMTVSLMVDHGTHQARLIKASTEDLQSMFENPHLITAADGARVRQWNEGGKAAIPGDQIKRRARMAAADGMESYKAAWAAFSPVEKKLIGDDEHNANKVAALAADAAPDEDEPKPDSPPEHFEGTDPAKYQGAATRIQAADGAIWSTEDGGLTWQKAS